MESVTWVQFMDKATYISVHTNAFKKGMNPSIISPT